MTNLKARAFAAYLGSEVVGTQHGHGYLRGVDMNRRGGSIMVEYDKNLTPDEDYITNSQATPIATVKLLLKPLSSISESDCIEVAKMVAETDCMDNYTYSLNRDDLTAMTIIISGNLTIKIGYDNGDIFPSMTANRYHRFPAQNIVKTIDFLRSKSYCLPFAGFDLIKENIAILKTEK